MIKKWKYPYMKIHIPIHYDMFLDGVNARYKRDFFLSYLVDGKYWLW